MLSLQWERNRSARKGMRTQVRPRPAAARATLHTSRPIVRQGTVSRKPFAKRRAMAASRRVAAALPIRRRCSTAAKVDEDGGARRRASGRVHEVCGARWCARAFLSARSRPRRGGGDGGDGERGDGSALAQNLRASRSASARRDALRLS
eukprot:scaffold3540_cov379-Prasinococcus_capsulatus_cf.AAC.8